MIVLVAAVDDRCCMGNGTSMPWHVPAELAFFRKQTLHHHILMGRVTWEHIPGTLPLRYVHVLSHHAKNVKKTGYVQIEEDLQAIIKKWEHTEECLLVCGGRQLYEQCLPYAKQLWLSHIPRTYDGNVMFPAFAPEAYRCIQKTIYTDFTFFCLEKKGEVPCVL